MNGWWMVGDLQREFQIEKRSDLIMKRKKKRKRGTDARSRLP
jgi:hypothetical protein